MSIKLINVFLFISTLLLSGEVISQEMVIQSQDLSAKSVKSDVAEYIVREQQLMVLIKNLKMQNVLLSDDFQVWSDINNDWLSKTEWLKTATHFSSVNVLNLSVRVMDDFSVVSFFLDTTQGRHKKHTIQFIVDIWRKSTNKLTIRYVSGSVVSHSGTSWHTSKF